MGMMSNFLSEPSSGLQAPLFTNQNTAAVIRRPHFDESLPRLFGEMASIV
jgi:hypothetical protein